MKLKLFLVIRIRGNMGVAPEVLDTLNRLNVPRKHNAALMIDSKSNIGMLYKVADYVTWGEITQPSLEALLEKRGRLSGDKRLTQEAMEKMKTGTFKEISEHALADGTLPPAIKKTFRLTPPSGGYNRSIKRHYGSGGELGYRGESINKLLEKML
jgi:large subunit ribosomal protein L30